MEMRATIYQDAERPVPKRASLTDAEYVEGMERLIEASKDLSLARGLDAVMTIVRQVARALTGADGATFVLRDGDRCFYADEDAIAPLWKGRRFPIEACISGWAMQHREPVAIEDIYKDSRIPISAYRPTFVKSLAMVPIRESDPIGAIGNYWARTHRTTPTELRLLQALADLTSVAMENVQRIEELRRKAEDEELQAKAGAELAKSFECQDALSAIGLLVVPAVADWYAADLIVDGVIEVVALTSKDSLSLTAVHDVRSRLGLGPTGSNGVGKVLREGTTDYGQVIDDTSVVSYISVPLVLDDKAIGAITFGTEPGSPMGFGHRELRLAEELGRRCAIALEKGRLYAQAQEAIRVRDEFLSIASHELKTPLTPLEIQLRLLKDKAAEIAQEPQLFFFRKHLGAIERQSQRLRRLVDGLLDVSGIMSGRVTLVPEDIDLGSVIQDAVAGFPREVSQSQVDLELGPSIIGHWDRMRLEQIVSNLLSNAFRYGAGKPVKIRMGRSSNVAWLEVEDQGIGIASEDQARIFDRFERAVSSRHYGGVGVGLFVARRFAEAMGGTLSVCSWLGRGTTFTVTLPLITPRDSGTK